jgi:hypothetical protein
MRPLPTLSFHRETHVEPVAMHWEAVFQVNGSKRTRSFAIDKYGDDVTYLLAVQTRTVWEHQHGVERKGANLPTKEEVAQLAQVIRERFGAGSRAKGKRHKTYNDGPMYGIVFWLKMARSLPQVTPHS